MYAWGSPGRQIQGLPGFYEKREDGGFVPPPDRHADMEAQSLKVMIPSIKSDLSLLNSIYELKDFRSLLTVVPKAKAAIAALKNSSQWRSLMVSPSGYSLSRLIRETTRQIANSTVDLVTLVPRVARKGASKKQVLAQLASDQRKRAAGLFLQWKFAISPLISDILGVYTALSSYQRRLNELIAKTGRPQRRHFSFRWQEFPDTIDERDNTQWFPYPPHGGLIPKSRYVSFRRVITEPTTFHAEIEYNIVFSQYQLANAQVLGLLDSLGVNLNPRIVWAAIPWSFVIDWVAGVGRWLDQFAIDNMKPQINIRNYLSSVLRKRRIITSHICENWLDVQRDRQTVALPMVVETAYRRWVHIPSSSSIQTSGLNSMEFTLGAALVLAQGRRRRVKNKKGV